MFRIVPIAATLAALLPAQDQGMLVATPAAFTVRPGTKNKDGLLVDSRQIYTKKSGFERAPAETVPCCPGVPDFTFATLFRGQDIEIDALSLGLDEIPVDRATGRISMPAERWTGLMFSIQGDPSPGTAGGVIERERTRLDGCGADVFTFPLAGSALPPDLIGTRRSLDSVELELFDPASGAKGDIGALDGHLPAYHMDADIVGALPPPVVFFSVSNATLANVPIPWWAGTGPSGATILRTCWTGTAWSVPHPAVTFFGLGLARVDDIDALAIEYVEGMNFEVVFSTTVLTTVATSQLMYADLPPIGPCIAADGPTVLVNSEGQPVEDDLMKGDGNIDAVCLKDPDVIGTQGSSACSNRLLWSFVIGSPVPHPILGLLLPDPPFARELEASLYRDCPTDLGRKRLRMHMTDWPGGVPMDGLALPLAYLGRADGTPLSGVLDVVPGGIPRTAGDPDGGPLSATIKLPLWVMAPSCRDLYLWTVWVAVSSAGNFAQSYPVRIRL